MMQYSVYSVAKTFCEQKNWQLSNLALNKLVYLAHMVKLGKTSGREGLVSNAFEAWDYGPVSPALYHKAKVFGAGSVGNIFHQYESVQDEFDFSAIREVLDGVGDMTPGQLVAITHMDNGAWYNNYEPGVKGSIIPDEEILAEYVTRANRQSKAA